MEWSRRGAIALAAFSIGILAQGATLQRPIGVADSEAGFTSGTTAVRGQASLFDGDPLRSQFLPTRIFLKDGSRYVLGIGSEASVYRDHVVLREGSAEVLSSGRPSRIVASSIGVTAEKSGTAATVYAGRDSVTVLVRRGEVKVARLGSVSVTTLTAGRSATLKANGRDGLRVDSDNAVIEASRIQAVQISRLNDAAQQMNCLDTRVKTLSRAYSDLAAQLAVAQSTRSVLEQRVQSGTATPADVRELGNLSANLRSLQTISIALAGDLGGVIPQHHPGESGPASGHTVHDHFGPEHHDQHGHSGSLPRGHQNPQH